MAIEVARLLSHHLPVSNDSSSVFRSKKILGKSLRINLLKAAAS